MAMSTFNMPYLHQSYLLANYFGPEQLSLQNEKFKVIFYYIKIILRIIYTYILHIFNYLYHVMSYYFQ